MSTRKLSKAEKQFYREKARREMEPRRREPRLIPVAKEAEEVPEVREMGPRLIPVAKEESPVATDSLVVYKEAEEVPEVLGHDELPELIDGNALTWMPHKVPIIDFHASIEETEDSWVILYHPKEMSEDAEDQQTPKTSIWHHFVMVTTIFLDFAIFVLVSVLVSLYFEAFDHVVILGRIILGFSFLVFDVLWQVSVPVLAWMGALLVRFPLP